MNATEFDALAQLTLVEFAQARLRFEHDLAQAFGDRGPAAAGIPQRVQDTARDGTLVRLLYGERTGTNVCARAYHLTLGAAEEAPPPEYLHVVCVDAADAVSYLGLWPLRPGKGPTHWSLKFWNLDYSILAKLRWYGFAKQYGLGDSANFAIRRDRWEGWSQSERDVAVARVRRLARETNIIIFGKDRPLPLTIGAIDPGALDEPPRTVYRGLT